MPIVYPNGWVTDYYHLDHIQVTDGSYVERSDRIANYADNEGQATCCDFPLIVNEAQP